VPPDAAKRSVAEGYRWIYGKDSLLAQSMESQTWEVMQTTPEEWVETMMTALGDSVR
jgi:hypothetical protein